MKILSLTERSRDVLERVGMTVSRLRHGGREHEYWKFAITNHLQAHGYRVTEECSIGAGKTVDLHAVRNDQELWIEVETGRSDITANAAKCVALRGDIIFVFADPRLRSKCAGMISEVLPAARLLTTADLSRLYQ